MAVNQKPSILELEKMLDDEETTPIEILATGEIRPVGTVSQAQNAGKKPLTMREDLGGEYGEVAWI